MSDFSDFYTDKENTKRGASWTRRKKSDLRNVYTRRNLLLNPDILLDFNPVFKREVIRGMRSISKKQRFYICALIALPIFCAYLYSILLFAGSASAIQEIVDIQAVLNMLRLYMLMLVLFFVPGVAATSIVSERERQTLAPLQISLLSPFSIVFGKVLASLFFPMLLALTTLPLWLAATVVNESITIYIFDRLLAIVITAFFIASVALLCSAVMDTTLAIIVSYIFAPLAFIVHYTIASLFTSLLLRIAILPFWMTDAVATTLVSTLCLWLTSLTLTTPHSGMTTELKAKDVLLHVLVASRLRRYG